MGGVVRSDIIQAVHGADRRERVCYTLARPVSEGPTPPDAAVSYRFYQDGDDESLLALLQAAFGRWPRAAGVAPLDHLRWKLSGPGANGRHIIAAAEGRIIASRITMPLRMKVRGHAEAPLRLGVDTATHPDWQGRGLLRQMRAFGWDDLARDFHLSLGTTGDERVLRQDLRDGRHELKTLEVLECTAEASAAPPAPAVREADRFDARVDGLWRAGSAPFDIAVVRSQGYLNWRYADPRAGAFTILLAEEDARLLGYAVVTIDGDKGHFADVFALPERDDAVESLVRAGLARLRERGAARTQVWCSTRHPYRAALLHCGFAMKRRHRGLTLGAYRAGYDDFLAMVDDPETAVHLTAGDTDLV